MFQGMTPWGPIFLAAVLAAASALAVWRATADARYALAAASFVIGLAAAALGAIATIGFVGAAIMWLVGAALFMSARAGR